MSQHRSHHPSPPFSSASGGTAATTATRAEQPPVVGRHQTTAQPQLPRCSNGESFYGEGLTNYEKQWPQEHAAEQTLRPFAGKRSDGLQQQQALFGNGTRHPLQLPPLSSLPLRGSPLGGGGASSDTHILAPLRASKEPLQPTVAVAPPIPFIPTSFSLKSTSPASSSAALLALHHSNLPSLHHRPPASSSEATRTEVALPPFVIRGAKDSASFLGGHDYPMYDALMPVGWNTSSKVIAQRERLLRAAVGAGGTAGGTTTTTSRPPGEEEAAGNLSSAALISGLRLGSSANDVDKLTASGAAAAAVDAPTTTEDSEEGYREGFMDGYKEGRKEGYQGTHRFKEAYRDGFREGRAGGYIDGKQEGYRGGRIDGALATSLDEEWDIDQYGNMLDSAEAIRVTGWRGQTLPRRAKRTSTAYDHKEDPPMRRHLGQAATTTAKGETTDAQPARPPPQQPPSAIWERVPVADNGESNRLVSSLSSSSSSLRGASGDSRATAANADGAGDRRRQHSNGTHRHHHHHHHNHSHSHHHYHSHDHHHKGSSLSAAHHSRGGDHSEGSDRVSPEDEDIREEEKPSDENIPRCGRTGSDTRDEKEDIAEEAAMEKEDYNAEKGALTKKSDRKKRKREAEGAALEDTNERPTAAAKSKRRARSEKSLSSVESTDNEKKRKRATREQLELLERVFEQEELPSRTRRKELANELGFSPRRIQIWFQNRRAKSKKKEGKQYVMVNYGKHSFKKEPTTESRTPGGPRPGDPLHRANNTTTSPGAVVAIDD